MQSLKILNAFNMAQDAYNVTKAMRDKGIQADLLVPRKCDSLSDPSTEDSNAYSMNWVKTVDWRSFSPLLHAEMLIKLKKIATDYSFVFAHVPTSMYFQFYKTPWVPYDAGLIRHLSVAQGTLPFYKTTFLKRLLKKPGFKLLARSYEKAERIVFTNPDTIYRFEEAGLADKVEFIPFCIPTDKYRPQPKLGMFGDYSPIVFLVSRHHWREKGSDRAINAFGEFVKTHPEALLLMIELGTDLEASKKLAADKIPMKNYRFLPFLTKDKLTRVMAESDIVMDQFIGGCWGTATPEAMACEKPVLLHYDKDAVRRYFPDPPICFCGTVGEIKEQLERCSDSETSEDIGRLSREYVMKTHSPEIVVKKHMKIVGELV
jgi:glycosyltransferase involved in cell wall biosynthesis